MDEVPGFRALMRSFYATSLGQLSPQEALGDVEKHAELVGAVLDQVDRKSVV